MRIIFEGVNFYLPRKKGKLPNESYLSDIQFSDHADTYTDITPISSRRS